MKKKQLNTQIIKESFIDKVQKFLSLRSYIFFDFYGLSMARAVLSSNCMDAFPIPTALYLK